MSWKCNCGIIWVNAVKYCIYCADKRHDDDGYDSYDKILRWQTLKSIEGISFMSLPEHQRDDLFTQFYAHEKVLVSQMSNEELREHRDKLRKIILEAKARYQAADDIDRERKSKLSPERKSWLVTDDEPNPLVSDAIAAVKTRAERMSKADKLRLSMEKLGLPEDFINDAVRKLEKNATEAGINKASFNVTVKKEVEKKVEVVSSEPKPVFNPSSLFGSK